jgi:riboflavin biosynthesis pyrimidine reductase
MSATSVASPRDPTVGTPVLDMLFERGQVDGDVRGERMPPVLRERYGGALLIPLRRDQPTIVANFVSTLDGIVAFGQGRTGGGLISGSHEPDRFVMALLRGMADAVVVGAGTVRGSRRHGWTSSHIHPDSAGSIATWRAAMGLPPQPTTIVVSASGDVPLDHAGLSDPDIPVVIATTPTGASRLRATGMATHARIEPIGSDGAVSALDLAALAVTLGARLVLTEGGPHLMAAFVRSESLDELFLTLAPRLVGRTGPERPGLVEGVALPPESTDWMDIVSVRRSDEHLLLRYRRRD